MAERALTHSITYSSNNRDFDRRDYSEDEKKALLEYMAAFKPNAVAGLVFDVVTQEWQKDENLGYTDGTFIWASQDTYHVDKYNAAVTEEFLASAIEHFKAKRAWLKEELTQIVRENLEKTNARRSWAKENGLLQPGLDSNRALFADLDQEYRENIEKLKMRYRELWGEK